MPVIDLDITKRTPFADGMPFGEVGPYELLEGVARFAIDPLHPSNTPITDVELAPRDSEGNVHFSSHFSILQPVNGGSGKGHMLFDVVNRGKRTVLTSFNSAPRNPDPASTPEAGNGYLMREGYTIVWCGWQADVPPRPGLIGMQAPQAQTPDGGPLVGRILCQFQANEPTQLFYLADREHFPHPPVDPEEPGAVLTVRDHPNGPATQIDREKFSFVRVEDEQVQPDLTHVFMPSGFKPGKVYQLVYTTRGSWIVGLGFAAMRDIVSFLKYSSREEGNPCTDEITSAYAFGSSQSGRYLRQFTHLGMNQDEEGKMSLDGIISHVAGGMRGEFNLRFGQPSKDVCFIIPELFPFTDTVQTDPVTGATDSMLGKLQEHGQVPKIMFTNTSAEYWRGDAALIHTNLETMEDAQENSEYVRRYHYSGTQHGSGVFPPEEVRPSDGIRGQLPFNSVDYTPLHRAVLKNLDLWVAEGIEPPSSEHPSLNDGTAVESQSLLKRFTSVPGIRLTTHTTRAMRLDYGSESHLGRTVNLPAEQGDEYPALVSDVDENLNEVAGIRLPDLSVPVATYTGWNLRHESIGNTNLVIGITGGLAGWTLGLPATREAGDEVDDPRKSIPELYQSKDEYVAKVRRAAQCLVENRHILEEDVERIVERLSEKYDYFTLGADED